MVLVVPLDLTRKNIYNRQDFLFSNFITFPKAKTILINVFDFDDI